MSGFGLTSRIIGDRRRRAGSRPEHNRDSRSRGRLRRPAGRADRPGRARPRPGTRAAGQVLGRAVGPLGGVGQDRPGAFGHVVDDLGDRQRLGLGQGQDADVELAAGQVSLDQDAAAVADPEPGHALDDRLGRAGHARLVDPQAGVLGLGLEDRRPGAVPSGDRLARPGHRERGRRQAQALGAGPWSAPWSGRAPGPRAGTRCRAGRGGRGSGDGASPPLAPPNPSIRLNTTSGAGLASSPRTRPTGGAAGTGQASSPPRQPLDHRPGDLDDIGLGGRVGVVRRRAPGHCTGPRPGSRRLTTSPPSSGSRGGPCG